MASGIARRDRADLPQKPICLTVQASLTLVLNPRTGLEKTPVACGPVAGTIGTFVGSYFHPAMQFVTSRPDLAIGTATCELRILRFRLPQDGNIRIGTLP
jgi:hypothetical protein